MTFNLRHCEVSYVLCGLRHIYVHLPPRCQLQTNMKVVKRTRPIIICHELYVWIQCSFQSPETRGASSLEKRCLSRKGSFWYHFSA